MPCIAVGYGLWTLGAGLKCMFMQDTPLGVLIVVLIVEGLGLGLTLQPSKSLSPLIGQTVEWASDTIISTRWSSGKLEK